MQGRFPCRVAVLDVASVSWQGINILKGKVVIVRCLEDLEADVEQSPTIEQELWALLKYEDGEVTALHL